MTKLSKKSVLLFAAAMAVCAFTPSTVSAASWAVIGSEHTLDSANFGLSTGFILSSCGESTLTASVDNAQVMTITAASFRRCIATGGSFGCTTTQVATGLPWRATAISTANIQIHGIRMDLLFELIPGTGTCAITGAKMILTGTLTGATYDNGFRKLSFESSSGLVSHSALGNNTPAPVTGSFDDTQVSLAVNP